MNQDKAKISEKAPQPARRQVAQLAIAGAALLAAAGNSSGKMIPIPPGIKIGVSGGQASDEHLLYLKQLGVTWVSLGVAPADATAEGFIKIRERWEGAGFKVYNIGSGVGPSGSLHNMEEVTLNLPGRDKKIEEYLNYIRFLGKAGIPYSTYAHMGNGIWRSGREVLPRGYSGSTLDLSSPDAVGRWGGKTFDRPLSHGRVYTKEEIWENYTYFIKKVVPVAEEAGVRIGIHPDDPPQPMLGGVPRCIFSNFEGYKRAIEIANSPNIGVCLCCGSWLEGGKMTGAEPPEVIKYFGARKKLFKIHFRNVSAPLPHFTETMIDDGYYDMSKIMRALVEVKFDGIMIPDHIPGVGSNPKTEGGAGRPAGEGYRPNPSLGYLLGGMNAMLVAAQGKHPGS